MSSMPWSRSTAATAPIRPSVFLQRSLARTASSVVSGTMSEKILACFTCPAITASVTPACFSTLMQVPSCPSEIQWMSLFWRRGGLVQLGEGLFLERRRP